VPLPSPDVPLVGRLLVANPLLPDPNFDRTVIMILAHGVDGALGVVLNRPSDTMVDEVLPRGSGQVGPPAVVFVGGPVNDEAVIGLARTSGASSSLEWSPGEIWSRVDGDVGTLDLDQDPVLVAAHMSALRVFVGYAGWAGGQLEGEIGADAWWVLDAERDDAFGSRPADLWRTVLRRQPGALALVAAYPADPKLN
jgi:putative transcriptional regulator